MRQIFLYLALISGVPVNVWTDAVFKSECAVAALVTDILALLDRVGLTDYNWTVVIYGYSGTLHVVLPH